MATQPVKTKFIEKTHQKVWNVSDHPDTDTPSSAVLLGDKVVPPGGWARLPLEDLEHPVKLGQAAKQGLVHIGDQPPADYLAAKSAKRAEVPHEARRTHSPRPHPQGAAAAPVPTSEVRPSTPTPAVQPPAAAAPAVSRSTAKGELTAKAKKE